MLCVTHPHRILHHTSHPSAHQYTPVIASGVVARVHIVFKHSEAFNNVIRVSLTVCVTTPSRPKPLSHPTHPCRAVAQSTPLHPSKRTPKALFSPPQQPPSLSAAQSPTQSLPLSPLAELLPKARLCHQIASTLAQSARLTPSSKPRFLRPQFRAFGTSPEAPCLPCVFASAYNHTYLLQFNYRSSCPKQTEPKTRLARILQIPRTGSFGFRPLPVQPTRAQRKQ